MSQDFEHRLRVALNDQAERVEPVADDPAVEVRRRVVRQQRTQRLGVGLAAAVVVLVGIAVVAPQLRTNSTVELEPGPAAPPSQDVSLTNECSNPEWGYTIAFPSGWHVYQGETQTRTPCQHFHPEPFTQGGQFDSHSRAVSIRAEHASLNAVREERLSLPWFRDHVQVEDTTVDGQAAVRIESVMGGQAPAPEDSRQYTTLIDAGERTLKVETLENAADVDYETAKAVHDRMVDSLRIGEPGREPLPQESSAECTNEADGYTIRYPDDWHTNEGSDSPPGPCRWFHPEPFDVAEAQEVTGKAVAITVDPVPFEDASDPEGPETLSVHERSEHMVAGRRAVRYERVASGRAMHPEGSSHYTHVIELDDNRSMIITTSDTPNLDYQQAKAVHDRMVQTLRFTA